MDNCHSVFAGSTARCARGSRRATAILGIAIVGFWIGTCSALAQTERVERPERRDEIGEKKSERSSEKDFTIGLDVPARYSSNVSSASTDSIVENRPDRHVTPDAYLRWAHQYDSFKASAEVGASLDRYFNTSDGNMDSLHSSFKIAKTDGKWEYFVPYASVSNDMFFNPTFKQPDITYTDIAIGFYSGLAWRDRELIPYIDSLIPYSDAMESGDASVNFDVRFGRRMSDTTKYQNTFASARLSAAYVVSANWRVEAATSIRARWYEDYDGERRTDFRPSASLGLIWSPDWLAKIVKRSEISFNFEFYRNYSNFAEKNYTLWEIGPTLSLRTKF